MTKIKVKKDVGDAKYTAVVTDDGKTVTHTFTKAELVKFLENKGLETAVKYLKNQSGGKSKSRSKSRSRKSKSKARKSKSKPKARKSKSKSRRSKSKSKGKKMQW